MTDWALHSRSQVEFRIFHFLFCAFAFLLVIRATRFPAEHTFRDISTSFQTPDQLATLRQFWINDYITWHRENRHNKKVRRMIFKSNSAGIGSRFQGLLNAYLISVLTRRVFLIDWEDPFPFRDTFEATAASDFLYDPTVDNRSSSWITVKLTKDATHRRDLRDVYRPDTDTIFRAAYNSLHNDYIIQDIALAYQKVCSQAPEKYPYRQCPKEGISPGAFTSVTTVVFRMISSLVFPPNRKWRDLQLQSNKRLGLSSYKSDQSSQYSHGADVGTPYVAVHARLGLGVGEGHLERFRKQSMPENFSKLAQCLARQSLVRARAQGFRKAFKIFLATDTPHFREKFEDAMHAIAPKVHVLYSEEEVVHISTIHRNSSDKTPLRETYLKSLVELLTLGDAADLVSLKSDFSLLGFRLGSAPQHCRIENVLRFMETCLTTPVYSSKESIAVSGAPAINLHLR